MQYNPYASEPERIANREAENKIKEAMEHLSQLWGAIVRDFRPPVTDPDVWPPPVDWKVEDIGTVPYHAHAVLEAINTVNQIMLENGTEGQDSLGAAVKTIRNSSEYVELMERMYG